MPDHFSSNFLAIKAQRLGFRVPPCTEFSLFCLRPVRILWFALVAHASLCSLSLRLLVSKVTEPSWHRRLRKKRQEARKLLKLSLATPGRKTKHLDSTIRRLAAHHGSSVPNVVYMNSQKVDGWCCPCLPSGARNQAHRNHCSNCGQHYQKVQWWPMQASSRQRSNSAKRKREKEKKQAAATAEKERKDAEILQPFGSGEATTATATPWVATTPTRTVAALLPQTVPQPSETTLAVEEKTEKTDVSDKVEMLKKALTDKGITDEGVMAQLAELEKASKEGAQQPTLTHKTINQLQKTEKQLLALRTQIEELDAKWIAWNQLMKTKFAEQGGLYKEKRIALQDRYKELKVRLKALRQEVQKAALLTTETKEDEQILNVTEIPVLELDDMSMEAQHVSSSEDEKDRERTPRRATASSPAKPPVRQA